MTVGDRWTWHGGGIAAAQAAFGDKPVPWIDLSTGINPHAWPGVDSCIINWKQLPDEGALRALEATAADYFGCAPENVCALPGTEVGLRLLGTILSGPAHYLTPHYRSHAHALPNARPINWEAVDESDGDTLLLANPGNPDGQIHTPQTLLELIARRRSDAWLVIDEAFADTDPVNSMAKYIAEDRKLIIFRSFGKFFGLAGVRLGFILGPRPILERYRERFGAWPVSAGAIAIGTAAYVDHAWIAAMRSELNSDAVLLDNILHKYDYNSAGYSPLFRLITQRNGHALFTHLANHAILTRPFDYAPDWLRIGLPAGADARARLEEALGSYG